MRLEIVSTPERLQQIADDWHALWLRTGGSVFQSHAWVAAWHSQSPAYQLRIGLAWDDNRLRSVLPCAIQTYHRVRLLEWAGQTFTDYCDALGDPSPLPALLQQISADVDVIRLKNIPARAIIRAAIPSQQLSDEGDFCLKLESCWSDGESWYRTLNKKKRNNHVRGRRKLDQMGHVEISYHADAPAGLVERLFALKQNWVTTQALQSPLVDNGPGVLTALVKALASLQRLCIIAITCNGEVVAGSVNAIDGSRLLAFFAAYDPKFHDASPGIMLMTEYSRRAFDHGVREIDYLRGDERYKFEFANGRNTLATFVKSCSLVGRIALYGFAVGRKLKKRLAAEKPDELTTGAAYATKAGTSRLETLNIER